MSSDRVIDFYERRARDWIDERSRQKVFFEKAALDRFAALAKAGGTILDLGCGPGKPMAAYLIAQGFDICGIDSSPTMISLARGNFPDREWLVADMRALSLGRAFDGVMAWDSYFHLNFEDQERMFPIFRAHAKPGAPLMFTSGPQHGEAIGTLYGEPLYHASLAPDEYRALLAANGFAVVAGRIEDPDCDRHSIWLARRVEDIEERA
jgi:SAM-dependent methyltransferase